MDVIGIIPARYSSTRFEGKVLADILGKTMIQRVWENAKGAKILDDLIVACDDERIEKAVLAFGGKVILTAKAHESGTDRLTEIANPLDVKVIVNIQADEPLVHPTMIENTARALLDNPQIPMATIAKRIEDPAEIDNPNVVKVVFDKNGFALYFSRSRIPYLMETRPRLKSSEALYFKHIGLYAYTKDFLFTFKNSPASILERMERLEQLRALEAGHKIKVVETKYETIGVDTLEDLEKVRARLKAEK